MPETLAARRLLVVGASPGVGAAIVRQAGGEVALAPASARRAGPLADVEEIAAPEGTDPVARPARRAE